MIAKTINMLDVDRCLICNKYIGKGHDPAVCDNPDCQSHFQIECDFNDMYEREIKDEICNGQIHDTYHPDKENGFTMLKPITVWKKFNVKTQKWDHNHIEDGHVFGNKPIGKFPEQTKKWRNNIWICNHRHLDIDGKVV